MAIITLTTDFGQNDFLVPSIKGKILSSSNEKINLIDITHNIDHFNIAEAAYILKNAYHHFPKESIHIVGVDSLPLHQFVIVKINGHYFVGSDNGLFSIILENSIPEKIIVIKEKNEGKEIVFPTKDIFAEIAVKIANGVPYEGLGRETDELKDLSLLQPVVKNNCIIGTVIYIDRFGNVITNINRKVFNEVVGEKGFEIIFRGLRFDKIYNNYAGIVLDEENELKYHGDSFVLFNSANYLEFAIYKSKPNSFGSAQTLIGLDYGDTITIEFDV